VAGRVLVVSPDRLTRVGLAEMLREAGYVLAGEAPCARDAARAAAHSHPALAVVEATPGLGGALSALRAGSPATRVVVFSRKDDPGVLREALVAGAVGFAVCPGGEADALLDVLACAARGRPAVCSAGLRHLIEAYVGALSPSPDGARPWAPGPNGEPGRDRQIARTTWPPAAGRDRLAPGRIEALLTPREQEVVRVLVTGASNREIADALHLSLGTIKAHVREILSKLGVHSRAAAVREAMPWIDDASAQKQIVSR
jgi:DNA-binding NarL/FixJ family response regulator